MIAWELRCCARVCSGGRRTGSRWSIVLGIPDSGRRLVDQAVGAHRALQRRPFDRHPVSVGHPGRGLPVRLGDGHRRAAVVGAPRLTRPKGKGGMCPGPSRRPRRVRRGRRGLRRLVGANPGYHRHLRLSAQRMQLPDGGAGLRLLDIGCGTGASTAALLLGARPRGDRGRGRFSRHVGRASAKRWPAAVTLRAQPHEDLADAGVVGPFDGIFAAYLVRNLADPDPLLQLLRAAAPGSAACRARLLGARLPRGHRRVEHGVLAVIIPAGRLRSGDDGFTATSGAASTSSTAPQSSGDRLRRNGFTDVRQ